ncbi:glycosyl transferase family 1 [Brachybacterium ginsengisoli]|uniref:D-inositol 3-phosphate glycosyltransferase n=1 Tax=Brachybacterium ginsengisoli TaxID=1331682 RepID=A0A291GUB5_9MICO|nr:glycosyltransferase [Brachybacterium ginsengisoli]ATG53770.1 glycosyl transferase family 1 [Brachybacterium ginsengisoli]
MHYDETRSDEEIRLLHAREAMSDPDSFLQRYEGLAARDRTQKVRIQELKRRAKAAEKEKSSLEESLKQERARGKKAEKALRKKSEALQSKLSTAQGKLADVQGKHVKSVREARRLREDLERVRGSRTFKVGKAVLGPTKIFRGGTRPVQPGKPAELEAAPVEKATPADVQSDESSAPNGSGATPAPPPQSAAPEPQTANSAPVDETPGESSLPVGERSYATLRHEFEAHPDPETFAHVLNRAWYGLGLIDEPARLIGENPDLVEQFEERRRSMVERILGDHRLRHEGPTIPPRAEGVAYLPEPGRLMYCVHSTPVFNSNGYSTRTRGVAKGLHRSGTDVRVVGRAGYPWDSRADAAKPSVERTMRELDGVQYVHLPGSGLGTVPMDRYLIESADAFTREALLQRPSVIQSASNYRTALPALVAARRLGVPFIYEIRGFWEMSQAAAKPSWDGSEQYETISGLETLLAREADHVLAITRQVKDELLSRGIPSEKISIAANAVDTDEFAPLPKDTAYAKARKIRTDVPVIGFAGSMVDYEGLSTLIEASVLLDEHGIEHQVVIAGSGTADDELRSLRSDLGAHSVVLLGRRPIQEMPQLLSTFDIVPIPRLSQPVTEMVSPLKPLEAFSSMKAVLLSDVAPHRDLAGHQQERARLFDAGSASSLADSLARLLADADLRRDLGRTARLWTLDERTWTHIAETMRSAHGAAVAAHDASVAPAEISLADVTIGLIADEFTTKSISSSIRTVPIDRSRWLAQLEQDPMDLLLVESAWEGNGGQWHRGVGDYGPDDHQDIVSLLAYCRQNGIPTAFWNKEDPIHFQRFRSTAALVDHVFTTDGGIIGKYLETPGSSARTVSSMPFYAQPAIHNPLPSRRPYQHTIAYAGTYYGKRYEERSRELYRMLDAAASYGLTIYDRQAAFPDSPYRFPPEFQRYSEGALPYDEVIDSYKSHLAHLNGNSVMDSPTMFSRRVVEIAACGGIALSGPGRGVEETFGGMIPASKDSAYWRALLHSWSTDPEARVREAWRQMRAVHRSHTVLSAMTLLLRTAGIPVRATGSPSYAVVLTEASSALVDAVLAQSLRPRTVFVPAGPSEATAALTGSGIDVRDSQSVHEVAEEWIGLVADPLPRTWFEDLLLAPRFGDWDRIAAEYADGTSIGRTLAAPGVEPGSASGLVSTRIARAASTVEEALRSPSEAGVTLLVASPPSTEAIGSRPLGRTAAPPLGPRTVLVAGHDLKFAGSILASLEEAGHTVLIDQWDNHTQHDEERSLELLAQADIVLCEWGLGNAVWYSQHVRRNQRLVIRCHSQELFRPYLSRVNHESVDGYVFVGELIRRAAVESHGVPAEKTHLIPNFVDAEHLDLEKLEGSEKHLGFVGIVPRAKRLDLAVDVLARLLERDPDYRLFIKGKRPEDYPWMAQRPDEMEWYDAQYARIEAINAAHPGAVVFDPQGDDMPEWYRKIGIALSTSDFESFHLTIADGAASRALPVSLAWPGSDLIYPREWLAATVDGIVESVGAREGLERDERSVVLEQFALSTSMPALLEIIAPTGA